MIPEHPGLAALRRIMLVADPEDVRIIVEDASNSRAAERERCAKVADDHDGPWDDAPTVARDIRDAIRALK